jgi:DNA-binding XRE family transcriptional regulator
MGYFSNKKIVIYYFLLTYKRGDLDILSAYPLIGVFIKKMQIKYNSDWLSSTIELMNCFGEINQTNENEEIGSIDYIIDDKNRKKLIRALVDENRRSAPAYIDSIRATVVELEEEKYDEAVILSKRITKAAHEIVTMQENLDIITPNMEHSFSLLEILSAIQKKTRDLCKIKCGKPPETREDCKGKKERAYECDIHRISDDANFHATMNWKTVLLEDFNNLYEIENQMKETMLEAN